MTRRARLTILELGASAVAWASCHDLGADDWLVLAQQSDEPPPEFTERVRQRARRLCKEGAQLDSIDVFAGSDHSATARRDALQELSGHLAAGGRLSLWSGGGDPRIDAELSELLAQLSALSVKREIVIEHQAWARDEHSGVRHAVPAPPPAASDSQLEQSA
jgi:hypothetical protein